MSINDAEVTTFVDHSLRVPEALTQTNMIAMKNSIQILGKHKCKYERPVNFMSEWKSNLLVQYTS